jgi:hypothetical protein
MTKESLERIRSILRDTLLDYPSIARSFGVTPQRVGQIARDLGIDGHKRQRQRTFRPIQFEGRAYPPAVRAVAREITQLGLQVLPYRLPRYSNGSLARPHKKTLLIDGVQCHIQCRTVAHKTRPKGREYVWFAVSAKTRQAKVAVFAVWSKGKVKLFVIPTRELKNVSTFWLPAEGIYATDNGNKPKRDWTAYLNAWHLLRREKGPRAYGGPRRHRPKQETRA